MSKSVICQICDSSNVEIAVRLEHPAWHFWSIYECKDCLTQLVHPMPPEDELKRFYDKHYVQDEAHPKTLYNPRYGILTFRRQSGIISRLVRKKDIKILDFGCGGGHFLANTDKHWDKYVIEISEAAREVASQKGIQTFASLDEAAFPADFFDIITMFAIIEHLLEPKNTVKELSRVLKKEALL